MNRLGEYLKVHPKKTSFVPFITAGDPNEEITIKLAIALQELGASALELGIPYSDPLADGPVIQRASIRALTGGMTLRKALDLIPRLRKAGLHIPVIVFTYYNLLLQLDKNELLEKLDSCDVDGLLVPDLPFEESKDIKEICKSVDVKLINLVAPTTSMKRLEQIGHEAEGFLYCVSSLGVTGMRSDFHPAIRTFLENVRHVANCPIAVGFGISSADQLRAFEGIVDGFIVGSAIVSEVEQRMTKLSSYDTCDEAIKEIRFILKEKFSL